MSTIFNTVANMLQPNTETKHTNMVQTPFGPTPVLHNSGPPPLPQRNSGPPPLPQRNPLSELSPQQIAQMMNLIKQNSNASLPSCSEPAPRMRLQGFDGETVFTGDDYGSRLKPNYVSTRYDEEIHEYEQQNQRRMDMASLDWRDKRRGQLPTVIRNMKASLLKLCQEETRLKKGKKSDDACRVLHMNRKAEHPHASPFETSVPHIAKDRASNVRGGRAKRRRHHPYQLPAKRHVQQVPLERGDPGFIDDGDISDTPTVVNM